MIREKVVQLDSSNILLAQDLIRSSGFWTKHQQGIVSPLPAMADRIEQGPHGLQIKFGANKFLVGHAITLSQKTILYELDHSQRLNQTINRKLLFQRLINCVRSSVAGHADEIYDFYKGDFQNIDPAIGFYEDDPYDKEMSRGLNCPARTFIFREVIRPAKELWKGYMQLGSHAIKVDAFVNRTLQLTHVTL